MFKIIVQLGCWWRQVKKYSTCHQTQVKSLGTFRPLIPVAASVPDPAFLALVVDAV